MEASPVTATRKGQTSWFFFSSRRRHTRYWRDWSSDVCSSDLVGPEGGSVQVTEGAVEVSTLDGGASDLVRPGDIAQVGASDLYRLTVEGGESKVIRSERAPAEGTQPAEPKATAYSGPAAEPPRINANLGEGNISLSETTGGLVEGSSGFDIAYANTKDLERGSPGSPPADPGNGTPPADPGNGNGTPPAKPGNG